MIDLEKIKEYCKSHDVNCQKKGKYCAFIDIDNLCMLQTSPYELNTKEIEKSYNKLFNEKT